jgi:hypothetical protein
MITYWPPLFHRLEKQTINPCLLLLNVKRAVLLFLSGIASSAAIFQCFA